MSTANSDARIAIAEREIGELKQGQQLIFGKLDAIANVLTDLRTQRGPAFKEVLDIGTRIVIIFGAVCTGIVYVAATGYSERFHGQDKRLQRLELMVEAQAPRPKPGPFKLSE